jgi:hypothetical protein
MSAFNGCRRDHLDPENVVTSKHDRIILSHVPEWSLTSLNRRFSAVSNVEQYRQLLRDAGSVETWFIHPDPDNRRSLKMTSHSYNAPSTDKPLKKSDTAATTNRSYSPSRPPSNLTISGCGRSFTGE